MKRIADIIVHELVSHGLTQVFLITGGGAMHLNDAFGRMRGTINICHNHHEQACTIAAEGYARLTNIPAVVNVTTGPGGINALNGVYGAYVDSIPMIVISGQIKRETMSINYSIPLRQLGDQEVDIISIVRPITKYAVELQNPRRAREVIRKAIFLTTHGRPGPVWIDVPMDIQGAKIHENELYEWSSSNMQDLIELRGDPDLAKNTLSDFNLDGTEKQKRSIEIIIERLRQSKSPVVLGGTGIHLSKMEKYFLALGEKLHVPLVAGWNAYDLIPNEHICYTGRPGTVGDRPGNFAVQNADFLLILGCRCNIRQISYNWNSFAKNAWIAQVDIDSAELVKPTLHNNLIVHADLKFFIPMLLNAIDKWEPMDQHEIYLKWCKERVCRYPVLKEKHKFSNLVNPYFFMSKLFSMLNNGDVVVSANATAAVVAAQCGQMKFGVRHFSNSGDASMGYDLPASIGAITSKIANRVLCLAGDGSIMMNLQELQTISGNQYPIKIFLLNNNGYLSIRMTQKSFFADNLFGTEKTNGVTFPNFSLIAESFGITYLKICSNREIEQKLKTCLEFNGPFFCEIIIDPEQQFEPKLSSRIMPDGTMISPELQDMAPFLDEDEKFNNIYRY